MKKFVEFILNGKNSEYFEVKNFDLETIKSLPLYKQEWVAMKFLEGEKRMFDGEFLDIYPCEIKKSISYGKKISYEETLKIIGNDLKYKDLVWQMDTYCRNSFSSLGLNIPDIEEYRKALATYKEEYYKTHFCLFTLPNNFSASVLADENSITIEEFDSEIILDYAKDLKNVQMNSSAGEDYIKENQFTLELFKNYFEMLRKSCRMYSKDIQEAIFRVCYFHFENFTNLRTIEDINFFLDICDYTYEFTKYNKDLFNYYREFVNEQYKDLDNEDNISLT